MKEPLTIEQIKKIGANNDDFKSPTTYVWLWQGEWEHTEPCEVRYSYHPEWGDDQDLDYLMGFAIGSDWIYHLEWGDYDKTWRCYPMEAAPDESEVSQ